MLVAEAAVEGFVGRILPWLPRIDECGVDARFREPAEDSGRHELGAIVRPQVARVP